MCILSVQGDFGIYLTSRRLQETVGGQILSLFLSLRFLRNLLNYYKHQVLRYPATVDGQDPSSVRMAGSPVPDVMQDFCVVFGSQVIPDPLLSPNEFPMSSLMTSFSGCPQQNSAKHMAQV